MEKKFTGFKQGERYLVTEIKTDHNHNTWVELDALPKIGIEAVHEFFTVDLVHRRRQKLKRILK
jgi:hypothetical protein